MVRLRVQEDLAQLNRKKDHRSMKRLTQYAIIIAFVWAAVGCQSSLDTRLGERPGEDQEKVLLEAIIRYVGYMPQKANYDTRFDVQHDTFYMAQVEKHKVDLYYKDPQKGDVYLLVSRIAPSLTVKRVGIGIRMRMEGDSLIYYEEVFRTWKMPEEELEEKGSLLFTLMAKGKDLSPYYPQNSREEYIEFPDQYTRYSAEKNRWISEREFTIEQLSRGEE